MPARQSTAPTGRGSATATRSQTVPAVPTSLVDVELTHLRRRGAEVAILTAPGDAEDGTAARPWFGPGADLLPAGWQDWVDVTGRAGEVRTIPDSSVPVRWLVGVGGRTSADWRNAGAGLVRSIQDTAGTAESTRSGGRGPAVDVALPADVGAAEVGAFAIGLRLGGYRFRVTGDRSDEPRSCTLRLWLPGGDGDGDTGTVDDGLRTELDRAVALTAATALARDLANMPSNVKDPAWLADTATRVTAELPGLKTTVRDERWLAERGFGGVIAVGGGSVSPPRLIELSWRPRGVAATPHLVLIGKGVTFDTGGISIKPADGMHMMRTDMSGAAAVIAAVRGIAALRLPIRVTGLAPAAENHVSGSAYRPGDVIRHYDGRTSEVTNTDAEGRMLLADALGYAVGTLKPDLLVDVATLTGAMKVALGTRTGGFFASTDDLAHRVTAAGYAVGERWWRMPLLDAHADDVRGELADVRQIPPAPGAVGAALFLREFTGGLPWAHLDIAGPARSDKTYDEVVPGGTGFAARTLIALAESLVGATVE